MCARVLMNPISYICVFLCVCVGLQSMWPCGTPQTDDSAGLAEALTHVDRGWEWVSVSPAPGSTVSAAGAGWPGAVAHTPLIKAGMEGACEANSPTPHPHPFPPFSRAIAGLYLWASGDWVIFKADTPPHPFRFIWLERKSPFLVKQGEIMK